MKAFTVLPKLIGCIKIYFRSKKPIYCCISGILDSGYQLELRKKL